MRFGQEPIRQNWFNLTIYLYQYHVLPLYTPIVPVDSMFSFTGLSLTNVSNEYTLLSSKPASPKYSFITH